MFSRSTHVATKGSVFFFPWTNNILEVTLTTVSPLEVLPPGFVALSAQRFGPCCAARAGRRRLWPARPPLGQTSPPGPALLPILGRNTFPGIPLSFMDPKRVADFSFCAAFYLLLGSRDDFLELLICRTHNLNLPENIPCLTGTVICPLVINSDQGGNYSSEETSNVLLYWILMIQK